MKKYKETDALEREDGVDMISNLPDPILYLILSGLPTTEEVIRTSILSTRWRYLWTLLLSIDIDYSRRLEFNRNKFKKFVDHVLEDNPLDLDSFRLCCLDHYNLKIVGRWIQAAVSRNIKQLHLLFFWRENDIELPHCLVTCTSLEVLRLFLFGHHFILPNFTGFPALRVLVLNNVKLIGEAKLVKEFLKSCPLLEDLSLIDCVINRLKALCISSPKLKNLRIDNRNIFDSDELYRGDTLCDRIEIVARNWCFFEFGAVIARKYFFETLGSLKKVVIHPEDFPYNFMDHALRELFAGTSHVESLSTSIYILCFYLWPLDADVLPSLPNLKTLELTSRITVNRTPMISKLSTFLTRLPNLESLHLIIEEERFWWEDWKLDEVERMGILTRHLKKVEFHNFYTQKLILDIARSLLEHGSALEEMVFRWDCDEAMFHKRSMETMKEVSKFHKASSTVKLITLNEISYYWLSGIS